MVHEPNFIIQIINAVTPIAGPFLTTIGGIAIAKIGANAKNELTTDM